MDGFDEVRLRGWAVQTIAVPVSPTEAHFFFLVFHFDVDQFAFDLTLKKVTLYAKRKWALISLKS